MKLPKSMLNYIAIKNIGDYAKEFLEEYNIKGKMLQVGGCGHPFNPHNYIDSVKFWELEYYNLDLRNDGNKNTIVGDILEAPFEDETFDFIFCSDTLEHVTEPWKAAKEMVRILKPGGLCFIVTMFSWRYHESPLDYWRFSPHCLAYLFKDLEGIEANWDKGGLYGRRGNAEKGIQGNGTANDLVPTDFLGAWRENWRVYYVGRKK